MVNATGMAKLFNKKPETWFKTQRTKDLINAIAVAQKSATADLVQIAKGGNDKISQGTRIIKKLHYIMPLIQTSKYAL